MASLFGTPQVAAAPPMPQLQAPTPMPVPDPDEERRAALKQMQTENVGKTRMSDTIIGGSETLG